MLYNVKVNDPCEFNKNTIKSVFNLIRRKNVMIFTAGTYHAK